ncbi:MAG: apolipoprotein N-acyltransferase [Candidatus Omnitrophota bacterium]
MLRRLILLPLLSAFLLTLAFPIFNFAFLAWFALIPLLIAIKGERLGQAFLTGYITGLLFFGATIYWVSYVAIIGAVALVLYLALYFGAFAVGVDLLLVQFPKPRIRYAVFVSGLWVALEYLRSHLFTGFGWALLGYTQWENLPFIQIADMTGVYGVTFLIVFTNVLISSKIKKKVKGFRPDPRYLSFLVIMLIVVVMYGFFRMDQKFKGPTLRISVLQANIPQYRKWDEKYEEDILESHIRLTKEAAKDGPNLIIWPETSVPGYLEKDENLFKKISNLAKGLNTYLLVGTPTQVNEGRGAYFNSAVLISNNGKILRRYDKLHLVPFGEYVPFGDSIFSFVRERYDVGEDFSPGKEYTIFEVPIEKDVKAKFGVLICFEDILPELVRGFVKNGADFMVNITNDAWFMKTGAPYQHAQASVFRAIENRMNLVRSANTGYSCFIDQKGKVVESVKDLRGERIFVSGYATAEIVPIKGTTFYSKHGDLFAWVCIGAFLFDLTFYFIYNYINLRRKGGRSKRDNKTED